MPGPHRPVLILSGGGGGGGASWGGIMGTLSDQTDLQIALDAKQDSLGYTPEDVANKDTTTTLGTSDTKYPSQKAVKTYADTKTTAAAALTAAAGIKLDDFASPDDNTDLNATTTAHGLLPKATAPAANVLNVVGLANGETAYTNKPLFDATNPAALGTAGPGTSLIAAHRDHVHTLPAIDATAAATDITTRDATTSAHGLVVKATAPSAGLRNVVAIDNAETVYKNAALFDATVPAVSGTAATGSAMAAARRDHVHPTQTIGTEVIVEFAASDMTTAITAGTVKFSTRARWGLTLTAVRASVVTAPTGSTILIDVNKNGTTVLSTKLMIDATELTSVTAATPYVISVSAFTDDDVISVDFDQVGSTIAGAGVVIALYFTRTS